MRTVRRLRADTLVPNRTACTRHPTLSTEHSQSRRPPVEPEFDGRGSAILVVEENRFLCEMICAWLHGAGYLPQGVQTEQEAAGALERGGFDLVLLDLDLPHNQAVSLVNAVRSRLTGMAVVLLTG